MSSTPDRSVGFSRHLAMPALLLLIVTGFFWKLTLTKQFSWLENPDAAYQVLPWQQVQAQAFHQGEFPLWDPYLWGGQSLIGQMQAGTAYPLNWLLYAFPLRDGHIRIRVFNFYFVFLHWLAALFAYWLCRYLGCGRTASLIGGLAFALAGEVGSNGWPQKLNGMIWIPLVVLFFLRSLRAKINKRRCSIRLFSGVFVAGRASSGSFIYDVDDNGVVDLFLLY